MNGRASPRLEEQTENDRKERRNAVPKMLQNGDVKGDGRLKIHRIPLCRTARCFVSHVTSPSCIWVKLVNHITEKLQIRDLNALTASPVARKDRYVMAPLEEGVYARARIREIIEINQRTKFVKVLFIDEGTTAWMNTECLAKMDEMFAFHPWQAIAVALFKVKPHQDIMVGNVLPMWSRDDVAALRTILKKFDLVRVEAIQNSVPSNDYRDFVKVNIYGMDSESDEIGTSVAHLFVRERCGKVDFERELFDGRTQKIYESVAEKEEIPTVETVEKWRLIFPSRKEPETELVQPSSSDWWEVTEGPQEFAGGNNVMAVMSLRFPRKSPEFCTTPQDPYPCTLQRGIEAGFCIPVVDVDWLNNEGYCNNGQYFVNVEGRNTVSPYEFYARPLKMRRVEKGPQGDTGARGEEDSNMVDDEEDAMIAANDELASFAEELNSFYGHPKNRKPISAPRVGASLESGKRVYGIVEVDDEYAQFTGCWQRIEILGIKVGCVEKKDGYHPESFFCRIRFLDSGGTDVRLLSSILEIHPMHCVRPPLCLQMCLHGWKPAHGPDWSDDARRYFFCELREDVPVSLNILGRSTKYERYNFLYDCQPFQRPNVLFVNCIQVRDGSVTSLDDHLQQKGYAVSAPDSPVQLTE